MRIKTTYMSGAGNLFTVVDNTKYQLTHEQLVYLSPLLCQTKTFKTEGLLIISQSGNFAFKADFYNPDGSFGAMCGNGARCALAFSNANKIFDFESYPKDIPFFMCGRDYVGKYNDKNIIIYFPPPSKIQTSLSVKIENVTLSEVEGSYVDVGSQHFVVNIKKQYIWENIPLDDFVLPVMAPYFRYHKQFAPEGVNFNIYEVKNKNTIMLRTYEKGVEAETGACGTGAISTALVSVMNNETTFPITVIPTSKIPVIVDIVGIRDRIEKISLEGPAEFIGKAEIEVPDL